MRSNNRLDGAQGGAHLGPYRSREAPHRDERDWGGYALISALLCTLAIPIGDALSRNDFSPVSNASIALAIGAVLVLSREIRDREQRGRERMLDIVYVVVTVGFFVVSVAMVRLFSEL